MLPGQQAMFVWPAAQDRMQVLSARPRVHCARLELSLHQDPLVAPAVNLGPILFLLASSLSIPARRAPSTRLHLHIARRLARLVL